MVAGGSHIVAHQVHQFDGGGSLGDADAGLALAEIAGVHQQHHSALGLVLGLERRQLGVALDAAVYVVGVEDDDHVLQLRLSGAVFVRRGGLLRFGLSLVLVLVLGIRFGALDGVGRFFVSVCVRRESGDHQAEHHDQRQQQCQKLAFCFHLLTFPFIFFQSGLPFSTTG